MERSEGDGWETAQFLSSAATDAEGAMRLSGRVPVYSKENDEFENESVVLGET